ncbi:hypothetical protein [Inhella sp.]|uniref:hypothetical protein n=1 Tax=Inhella sp. TaxID=1921806 RepID=UPI0035AFD139
MTPDASQALLNPQLWRLEVARRRRQLEELQGYLARMEAEFTALEQQVLAFQADYQQRLGAGWAEVESLQGELLRTLEGLARADGAPLPPVPPQRRPQALPQLPPAVPWPEAPPQEAELAAPSLKDLHRRAAMRLHPDRASNEIDRQRREGLMRDANLAYADQDRATLEALLIAAGESPQRLGGFDIHAHWRWLERCEQLAQGRLRLLRAHLVLLRQHPVTVFAEHVERARGRGLDALAIMELRLRAQAQELRRQLYIGERLQPRSPLSRDFLAQWQARWGEAPTTGPAHAKGLRGAGGLKGERAASSSS